MQFKLNKLNVFFGTLALLSIAYFGYAVFWCISHYPGGYLLSEHFLSDLGTLHTRSGLENPNGRIFNRATVLLGFSCLAFFVCISFTLPYCRRLVGISGSFSGLGLVGIGSTPFDAYYIEHHVALAIWLVPMVVLVFAFLASQFFGEKSPWTVGVILAISVILFFAMGAYVFSGSLNGHVIFQKIVASIAVIWFFVVFISASYSTIYFSSSRLMEIENQAVEYMKVIQNGHRRQNQP